MNIILANATISDGNKGCTALAITTLHILDQLLTDAGVQYTIYLSDSHQPIGRTCVAKIGDKEVKYKTCGYPKSRSWKMNVILLIKKMMNKNNATAIFKNADYILDIGQGDSFSDIYGLERFNSIDWIHELSRKYHKPYCILPQTIGPFTDENVRRRAIKSIANATCCMARDKQSLDYVIKNVPSQKQIKEYIDVAFFMPYQKIEQDQQYTHVGLNISALLWNGGYTRNNQFGLVCDYQKVCREIIEFFLNQPKTKVHLIPHVVSQERGVENDYEVSYELWREYSSHALILAPFALGPIEIKSYIAGMDFFMGARMHSTIAAFSSGVPVVPMAYSRKFNGLFADTLQYPYIADMKNMSDDVILDAISKAFGIKSELKAKIEERLNGVVKERENLLYSELSKFLRI